MSPHCNWDKRKRDSGLITQCKKGREETATEHRKDQDSAQFAGLFTNVPRYCWAAPTGQRLQGPLAGVTGTDSSLLSTPPGSLQDSPWVLSRALRKTLLRSPAVLTGSEAGYQFLHGRRCLRPQDLLRWERSEKTVRKCFLTRKTPAFTQNSDTGQNSILNK